MKNSYSNVGEEIQALARITFMLILVAGITVSIGSAVIFGNIVPFIAGVLIFGLIGYLSTIMLRAFGVLVQSVVNIEKTLTDSVEEPKIENYPMP